ncbi:MAG: fluoride efflux transporter CrcB [Endomicrobia bacterium]|nr:fluoride efflux transporter CrcB [Endomicrobiia bacterium]
MFLNAVAVFLGGAFGSLFRFLISEWFPVNKFNIPLTIIIINFTGSFIMGMADGVFGRFTVQNHYRYFVTVGLLGGFTTFSAFSLEFSNLIRNGNVFSSMLYVVLSVFPALIGFWLGYSIIKLIK